MKRFAIASALALSLCAVVTAPAALADEPIPTYIEIKKPAAGTPILMVKPEVELGLLTASGSTEPKEDWTKSALQYYQAAVNDALQKKAYKIAVVDLNAYDDPSALQILKLNDAVTQTISENSVIKLPTKTSFDYTLGDGATRLVPAGTDAAAQPAYALFISVKGSYSSSGRAAMAIGMALAHVAVPLGGQYVQASLIDLKTGQVVWYQYQVVGSGTDIRTSEGATASVTKLLQKLPL
jgi:hypothetical protein